MRGGLLDLAPTRESLERNYGWLRVIADYLQFFALTIVLIPFIVTLIIIIIQTKLLNKGRVCPQ
ncbi:hypothetical protein PCCS19_35710 [Paenibacillus sp. CCS19]|nr:hypothetical protein PCCS19_35710 [Paenibacillus cellulosilyticus]